MDLSIVIVSYNTQALLEVCLETLAAEATRPASPRFEVLVVDNASTDESARLVRARFPGVQLIETDRNLGFAAANNLAFPHCRGRYLMLLNADTEVGPGALATLVGFLDAHPGVGGAGPRLLNPDGSGQPSGFPFPTLLEAAVGLILHNQRAARRQLPDARRLSPVRTGGSSHAQRLAHAFPGVRRLESGDGEQSDHERHDWLTGACLVVRREVLETVGTLDERFFFEAEDVDWCRRIRAAGWEICLVPAARVTHVRSASGIGFSPDALLGHAGHCYYFRKHHGRAAGAVMGAAFWLYHLLGWVKYTLRVLLHNDPGDRRKRHVHRLGIHYFAALRGKGLR